MGARERPSYRSPAKNTPNSDIEDGHSHVTRWPVVSSTGFPSGRGPCGARITQKGRPELLGKRIFSPTLCEQPVQWKRTMDRKELTHPKPKPPPTFYRQMTAAQIHNPLPRLLTHHPWIYIHLLDRQDPTRPPVSHATVKRERQQQQAYEERDERQRDRLREHRREAEAHLRRRPGGRRGHYHRRRFVVISTAGRFSPAAPAARGNVDAAPQLRTKCGRRRRGDRQH
jgi:hypothetical protein